MSTAVSSISFVITAIYTYTFANAVYQILKFDENAVEIQIRTGTNPAIVLCSLICMVMALRFFFGNNNYVDGLFAKRQSALARLYHFVVIVAQSLILLGSSFLIRNPPSFVAWIGALFISEVAWYFGCWLFFRNAVLTEKGKLDRPLAMNEVANVVMAAGAIAGWRIARCSVDVATYVVAGVFVVNTAMDLKVNLKSYMGAGNGGTRDGSG